MNGASHRQLPSAELGSEVRGRCISRAAQSGRRLGLCPARTTGTCHPRLSARYRDCLGHGEQDAACGCHWLARGAAVSAADSLGLGECLPSEPGIRTGMGHPAAVEAFVGYRLAWPLAAGRSFISRALVQLAESRPLGIDGMAAAAPCPPRRLDAMAQPRPGAPGSHHAMAGSTALPSTSAHVLLAQSRCDQENMEASVGSCTARAVDCASAQTSDTAGW